MPSSTGSGILAGTIATGTWAAGKERLSPGPPRERFPSIHPDVSQRHVNLLLDHRAVFAPLRHELLVCSGLADAAPFEHHNDPRPGNRAQAMGDDEAGAALHQ